MQELEKGKYKDRHELFKKQDYAGKLIMFDEMFNLVNFKFPPIEPGITWFTDDAQFSMIMEVYLEERKLANTLYERTIDENGEILVFNVLPAQIPERKFFNSYVLQKFLANKTVLQKQVSKALKESPAKRIYLEDRISKLSNSFDWIPPALAKNVNSLKTQFLNLLNNGLNAARFGIEGSSKVRKKYVEQYLYCYGYLLIDHFKWLIKLYAELEEDPLPEPISIERKIALLQELGIIDFLKEKLQSNKVHNMHEALSKVISLLTSETSNNYTHVFEYVSSLHTATDKDCLTNENIYFIKKELRHLSIGELSAF